MTKSGLSENCDCTLAVWDMYAIPNEDGISSNILSIDDNSYVATVRHTIHPADLLSLLRYGQHCFKRGNEQGAEDLRSRLRAMIGAAQEPTR